MEPNAAPPKKSMSTVVVVLIVVGALGLLAVVGVGIMAALAVYGTRKYLAEAKRAEGRAEVTVMANGMVACAAKQTAKGAPGLPATSRKVPASLSEVSGKKYMSTTADWEDPAFACAGFAVRMPQYFQYEWVRTSATAGTARAVADLDGDGTADATVEAEVTCDATGECRVGPAVAR